jgi:hypothetical protein
LKKTAGRRNPTKPADTSEAEACPVGGAKGGDSVGESEKTWPLLTAEDWARSDRRAAERALRRLTAILDRVRAQSIELAKASRESGQQCLDAARTLEGVCLCLGDPSKYDKLARAATDLAGSASELPRKLGELKTAANVLVEAVVFAQEHPPVTPVSIATQLDIACNIAEHKGAKQLLCCGDEERVETCTNAIWRLQRACIGELGEKLVVESLQRPRILHDSDVWEKLEREFANGTRRLDPEAVVTACARMFGEMRELFGSHRKAVKRGAQKHK